MCLNSAVQYSTDALGNPFMQVYQPQMSPLVYSHVINANGNTMSPIISPQTSNPSQIPYQQPGLLLNPGVMQNGQMYQRPIIQPPLENFMLQQQGQFSPHVIPMQNVQGVQGQYYLSSVPNQYHNVPVPHHGMHQVSQQQIMPSQSVSHVPVQSQQNVVQNHRQSFSPGYIQPNSVIAPHVNVVSEAQKIEEKPKKTFTMKDKNGNIINSFSELKNVKVDQMQHQSFVNLQSNVVIDTDMGTVSPVVEFEKAADDIGATNDRDCDRVSDTGPELDEKKVNVVNSSDSENYSTVVEIQTIPVVLNNEAVVSEEGLQPDLIELDSKIPEVPEDHDKCDSEPPLVTSDTQKSNTTRSLRPGGGLSKQRLNAGSQFSSTRYLYPRESLLKLKSSVDTSVKPSFHSLYLNITSYPLSGLSSSGNNSVTSSPNLTAKHPNRSKNEAASLDSDVQSPDIKWVKNYPRKNRPPLHPIKTRKIAQDALEQYSFDLRAILNKITPQTFEKLTRDIVGVPVKSSTYLECLTEIIFEKAIYEQKFSNLYALLCSELQKNLKDLQYVIIAECKDCDEFVWVRDAIFENIIFGPYSSLEDCFHLATYAVESLDFSECNPPQYYLKEGVLFKVFKHCSANEFYVMQVSVSSLEPGSVSSRFASIKQAEVDSKKKNSVKTRLNILCQEEFNNWSKKVS